MNNSMVNFITNKDDGFIGRGSFSVGIDAANVLHCERISKRW